MITEFFTVSLGTLIGGFIFNYFSILFALIFVLTFFLIKRLINFRGDFSLCEFGLYMDGLRSRLVILRIWVRILMIYSRFKIIEYNEEASFFIFFVVGLIVTLILTFFVSDYLIFYFLFEVSLIPTFLIIMGWGYQPERLQAGIYFIFYTLTASLPLLIGLVFCRNVKLGLRFLFMYSDIGFNSSLAGLILSLVGIIAFLVKLPIYFAHLWLPKAHVEAPVAGSIILAGVLLKLGGYGLIRVRIIIQPLIKFLKSYIIGLRLVGIIYVGLMCCRLNDFKALVAYSSVAHMAIVICGCLGLFNWGFEGSLLIIVGHGLSSSGLFCIVNIYYERMGSRRFFINRGLLLIFPIFSLIIFILRAANIAAPPTVNLLSEIFLMGRILYYDFFMILVFPLGSFLGAVFTIFIFSYSQHGKIYYSSYGLNLIIFREIHVLLIHIIPVNLIILNPFLFLSVYLSSLIKIIVCDSVDDFFILR